ncbi:ABC transporter permease [candidate division KSB1 bacterium]
MNKKKNKPPFFAEKLFVLFTRYKNEYNYKEALRELYDINHKDKGRLLSGFWYWRQVLGAIPQFYYDLFLWSTILLKNYIKISFRNIFKYKMNNSISIAGLAIGVSCCLLVFLFVSDEMSYDKFHKNKDELYRVLKVYFNESGSGVRNMISTLPPALGAALPDFFPEIQYQTRFAHGSSVVMRYGNKIFTERISLADTPFFLMFSFPLYSGDPGTAIKDKSGMVITKILAKKYFGSEDPVGKTVSILSGQKKMDFIISGIAEDIPSNSTLQFNAVINIENISFMTEVPDLLNEWNSHWFDIYVKVFPNARVENIEDRFDEFTEKYFGTAIKERRNQGRWNGSGNPYTFGLQKMDDVHLNTQIFGKIYGNQRLMTSFVLSAVAFVVLLVACFNYLNLSIGVSSKRSKEIGVRKVIGALKKQLMAQFAIESVFITFISLVTGFVFILFILPIFNELTDKHLTLDNLIVFDHFINIIFFIIILGILTGIYPALMMSSFNPVDVLKGKLNIRSKNTITKILFTGQFSISVLLIIVAVAINAQLMHLIKKDVGYDKEGLIAVLVQEVNDETAASRIVNLFHNNISQNNSIKSFTATSHRFGFSVAPYNGDVHWARVDNNYFRALNINIVKGRDFRVDSPEDPDAVIVNERFLEYFELDFPVQVDIFDVMTKKMGHEPEERFLGNVKIIGVAEDFHYGPMDRVLLPAMHFIKPINRNVFSRMLVRVRTENISETVAFLRNTWEEISPDKPFSYYFQEEALKNIYSYERKWSTILKYVSIMAVSIACMGLFGLSLIILQRQIKEIGIRKVLGAKTGQIVSLNLKWITGLVLISNLLAWPAAYKIINAFLENYPYRIDITILYFIFAGAGSILISILTVIYNVLKSASANPVDLIRYE